MRRSDKEFKSEVLRRAAAYKARQRQLRKKMLTTALCVVLVCTGSWGLIRFGLLDLGMGGSSKDCAAEVEMESGWAENSMVMGRDDVAPDAIEPAEGTPTGAPGAVEDQSAVSEHGAGSTMYNVEFIEIRTIPETEEAFRCVTDVEQVAAIENAIEWIYTVGTNDENIVLPGGGTVYEIVVTYTDSAVRYELYGNALYCESDDSWIKVDEEAYARLLNAISPENGQ